MVVARALGAARSAGTRGLLPVAGMVFSVFLFPKIAPVWVLHLLGGIGGFLNSITIHLLWELTNREWIAGVAFAGGYIRDALGEIETEREFTEAERDALEAFAADVRAMTAQGGPNVNSNAPVLAVGAGNTEQLAQIRARYRETVMSVPDYDEIYDDGFDRSFAAEFGEDLTVVVNGGARFTRPVQQLLLTQTSTSIADRERHLDALSVERDSVVSAGRQLEETDRLVERTDPRRLIHSSFEELLEYDRDIRGAMESYQQLLEERQHEIHVNNRHVQRRSKRTFLQEYLYRALDTPFPVITSTLGRLRTLGERRRAVVDSIARRY
ncbi:MAG: DUF7260 family protein [Halobacteriota archaeon]|uniref:DUF7260 family protein n=1 Tax=Natronomonas sp. TaxID=2184060 RepID=UPI0039754D9D